MYVSKFDLCVYHGPETCSSWLEKIIHQTNKQMHINSLVTEQHKISYLMTKSTPIPQCNCDMDNFINLDNWKTKKLSVKGLMQIKLEIMGH